MTTTQANTKKRKYRNHKPPITLAKVNLDPVHDRRPEGLPSNLELAPIEVVDPYSHVDDTHAKVDRDGNEFRSKGARIIAMRALRGDPLARLHAHGGIGQVQY